ncbi:ABC-ATPase domain-containing protein [Alkalinema sp. FACHB-956]|uniref:ABC-ATPase domain-containing protein n=1 Tax=Alkalinema sp. FACHB-956 TaxID=2692768 RepID=UPI0016847F3E|nr:ABC-ATPase domain-containing protein [Alkalinema sp. FACHB-956]MBD2329561.1 ABC-ATPase domain-containing protein [Alkalinema sp. FACHB-956]
MPTNSDLLSRLQSLDGASYKAYREIQGRHDFPDFTLWIDRVQGDPFATPSQVRVIVPQAIAQFPSHLFRNQIREIALRDWLTRQFDRVVRSLWHQLPRAGTGNSGTIQMVQPGQAILERTSVLISGEAVEARFRVGLPAFGRRIAGREASELLCKVLPRVVEQTLIYTNLNSEEIRIHIEQAEDTDFIRQQLTEQNLIAFIADQAILPRRSGVDDRPLLESVISFQTPETLRVELTCPNRGQVTGMGIPAGVTLIVGGGYHGKSTLLRAIERGIYNHIPGDGREWVVTNPTAMKIRAEDGRRIPPIDLSSFINHLPQGRSVQQFTTDNASGSTSQAANILEALAVGTQVLLLDEDTCATNFMIRDRRMQALIRKDQEPITPFIDRIRQLYEEHGVSTVLVMGGCGDYLEVADTVIAMQEFQPQDVTVQAQHVVKTYGGDRLREVTTPLEPRLSRSIQPGFLALRQEDQFPKIKLRGLQQLEIGPYTIDLSAVEQLIEPGQLRAIASALLMLNEPSPHGNRWDLPAQPIYLQELNSLHLYPQGDLVEFRPQELAAALNRLRKASSRHRDDEDSVKSF